MNGSDHELALAFVARQAPSDRVAAEAALKRWLDFRNRSPYRSRVLGRGLALAFVASLGRTLPKSAAVTSRGWVIAYYDWLVKIGMNSANPFA